MKSVLLIFLLLIFLLDPDNSLPESQDDDDNNAIEHDDNNAIEHDEESDEAWLSRNCDCCQMCYSCCFYAGRVGCKNKQYRISCKNKDLPTFIEKPPTADLELDIHSSMSQHQVPSYLRPSYENLYQDSYVFSNQSTCNSEIFLKNNVEKVTHKKTFRERFLHLHNWAVKWFTISKLWTISIYLCPWIFKNSHSDQVFPEVSPVVKVALTIPVVHVPPLLAHAAPVVHTAHVVHASPGIHTAPVVHAPPLLVHAPVELEKG